MGSVMRMVTSPLPLPSSNLLPQREKTALLIIDVQERLAPAMPVNILPEILHNIRILSGVAREFDLPILLSEQYPKGLGPTVADVKSALPEEILPVEKISFSCCQAQTFQEPLARLAGYDMLLCGMETHVCVLQTALDLLQRGQRVFVAADAVSSRKKLNWQIGLDLMRQAGAVIGSTEIFAFSLLGTAGTDTFKRISRLVKE